MKKTLLFLFAIISVYLSANSQFTRYKIENLGSIEITKSLELKGAKLQQLKNSISRHDYSNEIVFQTEGLNALRKEKNRKYGRIIINIEEIKGGTNLNTKSNFTRVDLKNVDDYFLENAQQFIQNGLITSINKSKVMKINGINCIVYSFVRKGKESPVFVTVYNIYNRTQLLNITTSYRLSEQKYWKNDIEKSINSLVITSK